MGGYDAGVGEGVSSLTLTGMLWANMRCNFRNYLSRFQNYLSSIKVLRTHRRETSIRPHCKYSINPLLPSEKPALPRKICYKVAHGKYPITSKFHVQVSSDARH